MDGIFNFNGKKVIITGATGIIGAWISKAFSEAGADLWLVGRNKKNLNKLADSLTGTGKVNISSVDLQNVEDIIKLQEEVAHKWQASDFLINNAGIYPNSLMLELSAEMWNNVMELNIRAPFLMTKYFSKLMIKENKPGAIVNIISRSAKIPRVGAVHYATSKAALEMMTRGYSMELARYNIRVNAVSPGFAPGSELSLLSDEYIEAMCKKIPLGRTSGQNDAAQAVMYLCSDNASFITGSSIYVDGGNTAGDYSIPAMG
ncbi:MAG TPA: SDR family oxidoreductase [Desulfosporosinus sp.]|nr:SDR family oxidoreductase [Desulfosporosinus sp.]